MDENYLPCWIAMGAIAAYLLLFLFATKPVSLRFGRLGWILLTLPMARGVMLLAGSPLRLGIDVSLATVVILIVLTRKWTSRVWIIRTTAVDFWERIDTASRGLFLKCDERTDGRCVLRAGEKSAELKMTTIGKRFQCVFLPPSGVHGKLTLLVDWLAKQFPAPVPRVRIVLKRK